jgi:hypothetical protein
MITSFLGTAGLALVAEGRFLVGSALHGSLM